MSGVNYGKLIRKTIGVFFILSGALPLALSLHSLSRGLKGLSPVFLIPIFIGISALRSKGLRKIISWVFIISGFWLMVSGAWLFVPLNYTRFIFFPSLPYVLITMGGIHIFAGFTTLSKKLWSRPVAIIILFFWEYLIINFFANFMYTKGSLKEIISSSLPFSIPVILCALYLFSQEGRSEFLPGK